MCADKTRPNKLFAILSNNCPRCRRGKLFKEKNAYKLKTFMRMNDHCPVCGQTTDMEPGFYYGNSYVSYALAVALSTATFILWWLIIGFSLHDNRFFWWMGVNAFLLVVIQPLLMRLSRTIWLSFFIRYSDNWNKGDIIGPERFNKDLKNAW